ncbi:MAG TPA: hypothetical protein PK986_04690 [Spirochaetota bacterium]|nr:hypothetical protein [Spirochaetota bacterium]HQO39747.1 hypothetical protein [Spirochaetota bacterium]
MNKRIRKLFNQILVNSLNTQQVNYLGERYMGNFSLYRESGFSQSTPIPRQTAADTLMRSFKDDEDIVKLFSILLQYEGKRFYNRDLAIWGRDEFIRLLIQNKWIYDRDLKQFFLDPFYEREINYLNKIKMIDLRGDINVKDIIQNIAEICSGMGIRDLDWRVTMRIYDLERDSAELVRKLIELLLTRQNLQAFAGELFFCFKELGINASKANYKILFQKYMAPALNVSPEINYDEFLEKFKEEIEENGNSNFFELAKKDNRFYTITFQSTMELIEIWVTNTQNITLIEKEQILKKVAPGRLSNDNFFNDEDENTEGAGLGLNLIITILKKYSSDANPLKVVFYPDFIKIGFELKRSELLEELNRQQAAEEAKKAADEAKKAAEEAQKQADEPVKPADQPVKSGSATDKNKKRAAKKDQSPR